ncbi:amino acid adenylation domain-containing protein [Salmonella enterica subsp. enterica serovar Miami]|nr:amino acid adenylation domain-containing protein [Salmonella enterica]EBU8671834.1 hypothetical protein [Salmonella enterica subsp. enterica serovar Panama]ECF2803948.1 amino acid adenylation domain-containing protein [Salmonella enterica subsp. enterica serovar Miami]EKO1096904.1 amino acid adenylation domain-containing protein [Salmonella enterica subsp. enterica]EDO3659447.1 amino acid adenylation domain-containing protein [Salmonella enterica]
MNCLNNSWDVFPMSDMQKAYWISITEGVLENSSRIQYYCEYNLADFDLARFTLAWRNVLHRHDMLRMVAADDGKQRIIEHLPNDGLSYTDLRGMEERQKQVLFDDTRHWLSHRKFSCSESPQFDLHLLQDADVTTFLLSLNMWGVDAPSVNIILSDLAHYYYHPQQDLPVLTLHYRDYIREYSRRENTPEYAQSEAYWDKRLASTNEPPALPTRLALSRNMDIAASAENFQQLAHIFSPAEVNLLQARAKELDINVDTLILSAFAETVSYWNESHDFSLNVPRFNRPEFAHQINDIVGEFSSFSILSLNLTNIPTFEERIRYIHRQYLDDLKHGQVSGSKQLRKLAEANNAASLTTFPVVFTLSHGVNPHRDALKGKLFGEVQFDISHTPNVLLDCRHEFYQGKLAVRWDYVRNYFADGCIDAMFRAFGRIVAGVIDPDYRQYIQQVSVISLPEEQRKVRQVINHNRVPFNEKPLFRQFAELMQTPAQDAVDAVICEETTLSYQTLFNRACQLGAFIHSSRSQPEHQAIVAILLPKGWQQIVAVWGVLASGAAYLPLDIDQPAGRIAQILADARPGLIIVDAVTRHLVPETFHAPIVNVAEADAIFAQNYVPSAADLPGYSVPQEALIYVMYTSGTTGKPKGVMIRHKGVNNAIDYSRQTFIAYPEKLVVLGVSALHHDMSVFDTLGTFLHRGVVVLPPEGKRKDPDAWAKIILRYNVNCIVAVPAIVEMLLTWSEFKKYRFASLKTVLMGGDWIAPNILQRMRGIFPEDISAYSVGGPTETTMWNIANKIDNEPEWPSVPYGRPIQNCAYYILNSRLQEVPDWVVGEMYCGGISLAEGYLNDAQRTDEKFIHHPVSHQRLYNTGDLGLYHPDGRIEFIGRKDGQIKIRGIRIECGEVQVKLEQLAEVTRAVVYVYKESLAAALILRPDAARLTDAEWYERSKDLLPVSMIPSVWVQLNELPLTKNQKVDIPGLKRITEEYLSSGAVAFAQEPPAPRSANLARLADIWEKLLCKPVSGEDDNFFSLGGDSLSLIRLSTEILKQLKVQISFAELLMNLSLRDQVALIDRRSTTETADEITIIPHLDTAQYPLLPGQEDMWLAEKFSAGKIKFRIIVGFIAGETLDYARMERSLETLRRQHLVLSLLFSLTSKGLTQFSDPNRPLPLFVGQPIAAPDLASKISEIESRDFNLFDEYAWNVHVLPLEEGGQAWIFNFHHMIFDGWSINVFFTELQNIYGNQPLLTKPAANYGDYVCWKKERISHNERESLDYWSTVIAGGNDLISAPGDAKPVSSIIQHTLETSSSELLLRFCNQNKTTPFIVLFSIFQLTLLQLFNKDNFFIGISVAGRDHPDTENMLGCFISNPIFRVRKLPECTLADMVEQVKDDYAYVLKYPVPSFSKLMKQLGIQGKKNGFNDFCQACFVMQPSSPQTICFDGMEMQQLDIVSHEVRLIYEMSCWQQNNNEFTLMLNFDKSKVEEQHARSLMSVYMRFISNLLRSPDKPVADIV